MSYVNVGGETYLEDDIIAVLDAYNVTKGKATQAYLEAMQERCGLITETDEESVSEPRFIVITQNKKGELAHFTKQRPREIN